MLIFLLKSCVIDLLELQTISDYSVSIVFLFTCVALISLFILYWTLPFACTISFLKCKSTK